MILKDPTGSDFRKEGQVSLKPFAIHRIFRT